MHDVLRLKVSSLRGSLQEWKQVLDDCRVKVNYVLSPQAKRKIEKPHRWIQNRLVRTHYSLKAIINSIGNARENSIVISIK